MPTKLLLSTFQVVFPSGVPVNLGNELTPESVKDLPKFQWSGADPNAFYTLIMTDPDAPSRAEPKFREWHHLIIGNIPGNDFTGGEILTEFISSAPPKGSGLHRYVFLLYQQNGKIDYSQQPKLSGTSGQNRGKFSTRDFVKKYHLGVPVAGNFYQAEWDEYVPKVYAKLKD